MIAAALVRATGSVLAVGGYLLVMFVLAVAAVLALRDRPGLDLSPAGELDGEPAVPGARMPDRVRAV
ncbi:Uncharacterised protein [Mycobacteroides abscessus subsp. abscessus]|nr:Uncharacterised protein [Mycobacteroides abscessus subsp. abscessus]